MVIPVELFAWEQESACFEDFFFGVGFKEILLPISDQVESKTEVDEKVKH